MLKRIFKILSVTLILLLSTTVFGYDILDTPISEKISISFGESGIRFRPTPDQRKILELAQISSMIIIKGRTSTRQFSKKDERLALARASAARDYFIRQGVSPLKIYINYVSAMDYIADTYTREGRLANQRVDIEMIYMPNY